MSNVIPKGIDTLEKLQKWLPGAQLGEAAASSLDGETEKPKRKQLIKPGIAVESVVLRLTVAVECVNEGNQRQWKARSRRTGLAWRAVREAIGPNLGLLEPFASHYSHGGALRVTFTRMGGRRLDALANLGSSIKGVEDAIAFMLGADDGDPRWHPIAEQTPNELVGVVVMVEALNA